MHSTRLYREQHTRIRALSAPLLARERESASSSTLRSALAKLAGLVKLHLRDEDQQFYPRLFLHDDPEVRNVAMSFQQAMGGLAADFKRFYDHWIAAGAIDADPERFFGDADLVIGALLRRVEREDEVLYSLADRASGGPQLNDR